MIRKVFSKRNRDGWAFDAKRRRCWSWQFDIRLASGRRLREAGFLSRREAEIAVAKVRLSEKESRYGILRPFDYPTVEELIAKHVSHIENPHERTRAGRVTAYWLRLLPRGLRVNELVTAHLQLLIDNRRADGLAASSIDREMTILGTMLHSARLYFPALSSWQSPAIARPKGNRRPRRERVITADELMRVISALYAPRRTGETKIQFTKRRNVGHVFRMTLLCGGARKGEICKLRWTDVDWKVKADRPRPLPVSGLCPPQAGVGQEASLGVIYVRGTKTANSSPRNARPIEITESIAEILSDRRVTVPNDCPFIFTTRGGEVTHYYDIMRAACEAVGVPYGKKTAGGFVTHDMRHTAATLMLRAGVDIATVGEILGHTDRTMTMNYAHSSAETKRTAMRTVEEFAATGTLGKVD
jgi:integrase